VIESLGPASRENPIRLPSEPGVEFCKYTDDSTRIRYDVTARDTDTEPLSFEKAGVRRNIFFEPAAVHAAIVTCGGLCPGLNDVIRAIVTELIHQYGTQRITGIPFGFQGLNPSYGWEMIPLDLRRVSDIHLEGGTILGSSRERQPADRMVDTLVREKIDMLFCIGGDGTHRAAAEIGKELKRRKLGVALVGIPKTIDNDIAFVYKTFGFDTAVSIAAEALAGAHTEATAYPRGVGLVKLMGRDSGFIAAYATLASGDVNFTLVPEVPFALDGPNGFLAHLEQRLARRNHALIAVAEGAGQELFGDVSPGTTGRAENVPYHDIGLLLKGRIAEYFDAAKNPVNLKYMDPSYMIRSMPANATDSIFCQDLGRMAVHAAMAGKTNLMIGLWHNVFVHAPIPLAVSHRKKMRASSNLWLSVLEVTGQPVRML
jgi:6-phosphofructokinase 1